MSIAKNVIDQLRNLQDDDVRLAAVQAALAGFKPPYKAEAAAPVMRQQTEPGHVNGKVNPLAIIEQRNNVVDFNTQWFNYYGQQWPQFDDQCKQIAAYAKQCSIDLSTLAPEIISITDIKTVDDVMQMADEQVAEMERRIDASHEIGFKMLPDAKKKRWARTFRRIREFRELCRQEIPEQIRKATKRKDREKLEVWKHLHALRYMVYTERSTLVTDNGVHGVIELPKHLIMMCLVVSIARENADKIDGVLIQMPPRHGKSKFAVADRALGHIKNPWQACGFVHNKDHTAQERFQAVRDHFDESNDIGLRRRALFPNIALDLKCRSSSKFFLLVDGRRECLEKEGNLQPYGVHAKAQGKTAHELDFDDPVDEKEQVEPGTRERTNSAMSQTWLNRLTGKKSFFVYICTAWHPDDFSAQLIKLAKQGAINIAYYSEACGGPEDGFTPIWPEAGYDANFLRKKFVRMGPARYACVYQNNPDHEASKRIQRLHFYDWDLWRKPEKRPPQWQRFFDDPNTEYFLSLDPSGVGNKWSNLAGLLYSALGTLQVMQPDGSIKHVPKLVVLAKESIPASQLRLSEIAADFERNGRVDWILVETTSGFHATSESIIKVEGVNPRKVIQRTPGTGTKTSRLMKYAIHIETGDMLFPGMPEADESGKMALVIHSQWADIAEQLLRAGTVKDDNLLDCVRQQLAEVSYKIFKMRGEAPDDTPVETVRPVMTRKRQFFENLCRPERPKATHRPDHIYAMLARMN